MTTMPLRAALDALAGVAGLAGLDAGVARAEGEQLAAAVSEPATGAFLAWASELGRDADAQAFFEASSKGRRFRVSPTPLMSELANTRPQVAQAYAAALAQVASSACLLGEPDAQVAGAAAAAAAAQMQAGGPRPSASGQAGGTSPGRGIPPGNAGAAPTGGLDPDLLNRLKRADDQRRSMAEFERDASGIFSGVLDRLQANQRRIDALRSSSVPGAPVSTTGRGPAADPDVAPGGAPRAGAAPEDPTDPAAPAASTNPAAPTEDAAPAASGEPAKPEKTLEELLAELDGLVGLTSVKAEIHRQAAILRVDALRERAGLKVPTITRHLVFVGNPGTGKTTVARLVSGIYKALGLLSRGQLVEVDRSELVAGFLGQTALKTSEVVARAGGGVLFIDEAYSLSGDQYGEEAINTLVKEMEDKRDDLVVIVAGYPGPMATFIAENPGLASRFRTTILFEDYTDDELSAIFGLQVGNADYDLGDGAADAFRDALGRQLRDETFGNGRFARNVLEAAIGHQAWRLRDVAEPSVEQLRTLTAEDVAGDPGQTVPFPDKPAPPGAVGDRTEVPPESEDLQEPAVPPDAKGVADAGGRP